MATRLTIERFHAAVTAVWEMGKCNHPDDPGGATNNGVATHFITDFASRPAGVEFLRSIGIEPCFVMGYLNKKSPQKSRIFDPELLMSFTPRQCDLILIQAFWVWGNLDAVPARMAACATYDFCLNSGQTRGKKYLQLALNTFVTAGIPPVDADGVIGPRSLARLGDFAEPSWDFKLAMRVCDLRMEFLQGLPTFRSFGNGWTNRVNALRSFLKGQANVL